MTIGARIRATWATCLLMMVLSDVTWSGEVTPFRVIAHRGASAYAPENTLPAYEKAKQLGVAEVEMDIQLTRDGHLILFHDAMLDAKTNGQGRVRDHDLNSLRALDIGTWFDAERGGGQTRFAGTGLAVPKDLFDRFGGAFFYHIEMKSDDAELPRKLIEQVQASGLAHRVMITSFHVAQIQRMRPLADGVPMGLLVRDEPRLRANPVSGPLRDSEPLESLQLRWIDKALELGCAQVAFKSSEMSRSLVEMARARGLEIRAYGTRSRADMEHALAIGTNGMTIDWPDWLLSEQR